MYGINDFFNGNKTGKYSKCWLAATLSTSKFQRMFKSHTVNEINVCQICNDLVNIIKTKNTESFKKVNLYSLSQLMYGATKILSYQTSNLEKDFIELNKMFDTMSKRNKENDFFNILNGENEHDYLDAFTTSKQLHENFKLSTHEQNIDTKLQHLMHDVECIQFGAYTHGEVAELLTRLHITSTDDEYFYRANTLQVSEEFYKPFEETEEEMLPLIRDNLTMSSKENIAVLSKILPEMTDNEFVPENGIHLTPQKRQSTMEAQIETPTKRRRLRFENVVISNNDEIPTLPENTEVPVPTMEPSLGPIVESLENLELLPENIQQIRKKSKRKRIFVDKNTKLSHKVIKKYISNVRAHTVPLKIIDVNISTSEILFQKAPARFVFTRKNKLNNSLIKLFDVHAVLPSTKKEMLMESGQSFEKSTETMRLGDKSNRTNELPELSKLTHPELIESMTGVQEIGSQKNLQDIEENLNIAEHEIIPDITMHEPERENLLETSKLSQSYLTKADLLASLEQFWSKSELVNFTDIVSPQNASKIDAAYCYSLLLELHREKKITLGQQTAYETLWIQKYQ